MQKYNHDLLLRACASGAATEEEKNVLSYAASMAAAGVARIAPRKVKMAQAILDRAHLRAWLRGAP